MNAKGNECARCPAPVLGPSWFPQFQLRLPDFPRPSLDLCALASLAGDLAAIFKTYNFTTAQSPSITMMPASHTFPYVSDDIPSLSYRLPTALSVFRAHQVHDQAAPIAPPYLGRSVPTTATRRVIEVLTPRRKPPEVSALSSTHGPYVRHV